MMGWWIFFGSESLLPSVRLYVQEGGTGGAMLCTMRYGWGLTMIERGDGGYIGR